MMQSYKTIHHWSPFHVYPLSEDSSVTSVLSLMNPRLCNHFLHEQMLSIQAPNKKVTASLIMKRYAQLYVIPQLHSLIAREPMMRMPMEACHIGFNRKLYVDLTQCEWFAEEPEWNTVFSWVFANHITPMIEAFYQTTNVSRRILWENVAVRINSYYRKSLQKENCAEKIFSFLREADGRLFGLNENPLKPFLHQATPACETVTRKTCCYFYRLEKNREELEHCQICPLKNKMELMVKNR
ncbi:IucA/IucC family C-terminal-domain containing protein [Melghirimyces algeriensis]|uniref:Ferric iron reductase protein FhuF, involved in iron transport n=1 Tax=Melghirimyces algeriensis TaxID=910412 RepID=A0A521ABP5_9BACL|nr:IucA/IucC family C-terminal-domain containing protein [Melghirimyces algeriensis]SMO32227.1 Ferric iron reductase protein FhuF, involved in iron transport [Melghirimyces algeriensis]